MTETKLKLSTQEFSTRLDNMCKSVRVKAMFTRDYVGGLPANDEGLRAFIEHHLGLVGEEAERAFSRIKNEEIGEEDTTPETGENKEQKVYGVNACYRSDGRVWIPDWQLKACFKHAASDLGLFVTKKGSKGTIAELGSITAHGISNGGEPFQVFVSVEENPYSGHVYRTFRGVVGGIKKQSIIHDNETVPAGAQFEFIFKWFQNRKSLSLQEVADSLALMQKIGLGSCKTYETGQFKILEFEEL